MKVNSDLTISLFVSLVITTLFFALVAPVTATTTVSDIDSDIYVPWPYPPGMWILFGWRTYANVTASYEYTTPHGFDKITHTAAAEVGSMSGFSVESAYYIFKAEEVGHTGSYTVYKHECDDFAGRVTISYHKGQIDEGWSYSEAPRHAISEVHATYIDAGGTLMDSYAYASVWRST